MDCSKNGRSHYGGRLCHKLSKRAIIYKQGNDWYVKLRIANNRIHRRVGDSYVEAVQFVRKMKQDHEKQKTKNLWKRGNSWYCNFQIGGVRIQRKAGDTLNEAADFVRRIKEEYKYQKVRRKFASKLGIKAENLKKYSAYDLAKVPDKIPEIYLENYLENNLEQIEKGLKFIDRQVFMPTGRLDLIGQDTQGNTIYFELKTDTSDKLGIDKLCGQVSRYFNMSTPAKLKMYLVIPIVSRQRLDKIYKTLEHWIENDFVRVYHFDYSIYGKQFTFDRVIPGLPKRIAKLRM